MTSFTIFMSELLRYANQILSHLHKQTPLNWISQALSFKPENRKLERNLIVENGICPAKFPMIFSVSLCETSALSVVNPFVICQNDH